MSVQTTQEETITGSLSDITLEEIIESLAQTSRTGLLRLGESELWFKNGTIYLVRTTNSNSLSEVLFNADVGSLDEIESRFASEDSEGSVLEQLISEYPNSTPQLKLVLKEYNLTGLFELLVPSESEFIIEPNRTHKLGHVLAEDATLIIEHAKQRLHIWRQIAQAIPSTDAVFELNNNLPHGRVDRMVSSDEWEYISRINGTNCVADIAHETGASAFRVCSTIYRLMLEGLVAEKH